jgi:hypothetical protein
MRGGGWIACWWWTGGADDYHLRWSDCSLVVVEVGLSLGQRHLTFICDRMSNGRYGGPVVSAVDRMLLRML